MDQEEDLDDCGQYALAEITNDVGLDPLPEHSIPTARHRNVK